MKVYEARETERRFIPLLPIYARIDGRCFSRFTKGLNRPYDIRITRTMIETTKSLVENTQAKIGYTQSDEISLLWCQDRSDSELPFGGKIQKMVSVLASLAASCFVGACLIQDQEMQSRAMLLTPHFDCRVFQLPNRIEAANAFLWREQDATKNAISMAARSFYSHKELNSKNCTQMQEMILQKGQNFNDYPAFFKRGTFIRRRNFERLFNENELEQIPEAHRPLPNTLVMRSEIIELEMPKFSSVENRVAVIFDGADPVVRSDAKV